MVKKDNKKMRGKQNKTDNILPNDMLYGFILYPSAVFSEDEYSKLINETAKVVLNDMINSSAINEVINRQISINQKPITLDEIKEYLMILMMLEAISDLYDISEKSAKKMDKLLTSLVDELTDIAVKYTQSGLPPSAISMMFFKIMITMITPDIAIDIHNKINELRNSNMNKNDNRPPSGYI
jgi:hypothetical protein